MTGLTLPRIAIAAGIALIAALGVQSWLKGGVDDTTPTVILGAGDYTLDGTDGQPFTQASLIGQPSVVFFGFTHCPDVCPTTLSDIAIWQEELGERAGDLGYYFVTVDPERDTADLLGDYVGWVPHVVGVTGPRAEIDKALAAFRIYASRVDLSDGEYTMDHSAYVMLFDDEGNFTEPVSYQEEITSAVAKIARAIER